MAQASSPTPSAASSASSPSTPFASASLYVGDLTQDVTEALLFEIFNAVGPVASVRVCRDASTRRSLGYAYVNFHRVEDAERALDTMNFKAIKNRQCRIMWSHRDPSLRKSGAGNIFVNHLEKTIDNKSLYDTFSMFGNILSCKVATNNRRESLGYGFVHYESDEAAAKAINKVDGKVIAGQKVSVSLFKSKKDRGGTSRSVFTNVYVKGLPAEWSKEKVDEVFGKYGAITSSMLSPPLPPTAETKSESKHRGFAFINYANPDEAAAAVASLHDAEFDGKKLHVVRAQKKEERERELRSQFDQMKADRQRKFAGVNLYVKNLADDIDDEKLRTAFAEFGQIASSKVMRDQALKSRGFGFVCFSSPDEATKAVTEMNGRMLEGKPLYVSLAMRKDVRRSHLEAQHSARLKMGGGMPQPQMYGPPGPMFFPPGMPQQRMMYPQQMVGVGGMARGRWTGNPGQPPHMMGVRPPAGVNYSLMPLMNGGRGGGGPPGVPRGGGRGGAGGRGRGGPPAGAGGAGGGRGGAPVMGGPPLAGRGNGNGNVNAGGRGQSFSLGPNVRNPDRGAPQVQPPQAQMVESVVAPTTHSQEPLTIKALANAPEETRKQMIGERLYPLIEQQSPENAGKITGMLLEMDVPELIHLLESQQALHEKISEAIHVLQSTANTDGEDKLDM
jgi:polyadenylate-binding protein